MRDEPNEPSCAQCGDTLAPFSTGLKCSDCGAIVAGRRTAQCPNPTPAPLDLDAIRKRHAEYDARFFSAISVPYVHADRGALLAHVAELERQRDEARSVADEAYPGIAHDFEQCKAERDSLRAELAEVKQTLEMTRSERDGARHQESLLYKAIVALAQAYNALDKKDTP